MSDPRDPRGSQWLIGPPDLYGCRLWLGKFDRDGYGVIWQGRGMPSKAHRIAWIEARGPIPDGKELEHRCRVRSCCSIAHLTLVSRTQNERLKRWSSRVRASICDAGHDAINVMVTERGGRVCRVCSRG